MVESGRIGIATMVMRNKEYLVAIRPEEDALALHTMYFSDEVRAPGRDLPELPETGDVTNRELSMAQLLIESMESEWDPDRFHDTHREKVEALIEEKRAGHEIVLPDGTRRRPTWWTSWRRSMRASRPRLAPAPKSEVGLRCTGCPNGPGRKTGAKAVAPKAKSAAKQTARTRPGFQESSKGREVGQGGQSREGGQGHAVAKPAPARRKAS